VSVEAIVVAQIVQLFRKQPETVWELVEASAAARPGDVVLQGPDGRPAAYARPVVEHYQGARPPRQHP